MIPLNKGGAGRYLPVSGAVVIMDFGNLLLRVPV